MGSTRRTILAAGAAAAAALPRVFAQQAGRGGTGKFYEKGSVRIYYEEAGAGFPLMLLPGGGPAPDGPVWRVPRARFDPLVQCGHRAGAGSGAGGADPRAECSFPIRYPRTNRNDLSICAGGPYGVASNALSCAMVEQLSIPMAA